MCCFKGQDESKWVMLTGKHTYIQYVNAVLLDIPSPAGSPLGISKPTSSLHVEEEGRRPLLRAFLHRAGS